MEEKIYNIKASSYIINLLGDELIGSDILALFEIVKNAYDADSKSVKIQLKWLPDAQFMGYYVALDKGYYKDLGLEVTIVPGGGDIAETTAVYTGQVDFGVTWVTNLAVADAGGMDLLEIAQVFQKSGLVLVYKYKD